MIYYLVLMCIGSTSPTPVTIKFQTNTACQAEASKVREWKTMLYKCEAHCVESDLDVAK